MVASLSGREAEKFASAISFRFFDLPPEIRNQIYSFVLFPPHGQSKAVALFKRSPRSSPVNRVSVFLVSRRFHDEATSYFYSSQIFRIFPILDYRPLPMVIDLSPRYRRFITSAQLILGPSWMSPPKSWTVNNGLGLQEMQLVRTLKLF